MPADRNDGLPPGGRQIRWVFLDRDGTLNVKPRRGEYIERPEELELLPGAASAVSSLNHAGLWTSVVTNQRGVALGRMSNADLDAVHDRLRSLLAQGGAAVDAIYACTHGIAECTCRKPEPGLLLAALDEQPQLDFTHAAIIGDSLDDVEAGRRLGLLTVLLRSEAEHEPQAASADLVAADLRQAVALLLSGKPQ